jgi:hypothetical protein
MTRKQFEKFRIEVEARKFLSVEMNPITFGIQRLAFEKEKLNILIAAAEAIPMKTTKAKAERWKRKLQRADASIARLQQSQPQELRNAPLKSLDAASFQTLLNSSAAVASTRRRGAAVPSRNRSSVRPTV